VPFEQHWLQPAADPLAGCATCWSTSCARPLARRLRACSRTQKVEYGQLDAIRERHLRVYQQALRRIEGLLRQAAAAGQLAPGVLPKATARTVHALVHGLIVDWMLDPKAFDLQRAGRGAVLQLLRAVSREPART
jgi:TetR/AcrR family acrAB operon transcriptional repressor